MKNAKGKVKKSKYFISIPSILNLIKSNGYNITLKAG